MARKPARKSTRPAAGEPPSAPTSDRDKIVAAFLELLAERPFEEIGFADIAARAGVSLAQLRGEFASTLAILAAHIKATLIGTSQTIPVRDGRLALGRWQGIYFAEFDGPRERQVQVTILG